MKTITAKFNSKCAETGKPIKKGESMVYDYSTKKAYELDYNELEELIEAKQTS